MNDRCEVCNVRFPLVGMVCYPCSVGPDDTDLCRECRGSLTGYRADRSQRLCLACSSHAKAAA